MDNTQFNHLNMFSTVLRHASKFQAITDLLVAFKNGILALKVKYTAIQTTSGEADLATSGVTTGKNQLQEALVQSTHSHISPQKRMPHSLGTSGEELKAQMDLSLTELREKNDDQIGPDAQTLLNIINNIVGSLSDYGITPATVNSWQTDINNYLAVLANPRIAITHRASLTEELVTLFKEANEVLNQTLDPVSVSFKTNGNKHYLSDYEKARVIIDLGKGSTNCKGKCTTPDGQPKYNVNIKINEQPVQTNTDVDGLFIVKPDTAPATITLTATDTDGTQQTTPPFLLKKGDSIIKNFIFQAPANPPA